MARSKLCRIVARTGQLFDDEFIAPNPIQSKGFHVLRKAGQLERFVRMAAGRNGVDLILVLVDLDDGCANLEAVEFNKRISEMGLPHHTRVRVCFFVREYECLFLSDLETLKHTAPEYGWNPDAACEEPELHRAAKAMIDRAMKRKYKETIDQSRLTGRLDLKALFKNSRSYRKLVRCLTELNYGELEELLA